MSTTAAERRAARKRKEQRRPRVRTPGDDPERDRTSGNCCTRARWPSPGSAPATRTASRAGSPVSTLPWTPTALVERIGLDWSADLWEHGWQPADAGAHRAAAGLGRVTRLAVALVSGRRRRAGHARAPEDWRAQLDGTGREGPDRPRGLRRWPRWAGEGRRRHRMARRPHVVARGRTCCRSRALPAALAVGLASPRRTDRTDGTRPAVMGRIRGLLAKAESTEFPEEAEALTAKAQELMTRHAVDAAVLDAEPVEVARRRGVRPPGAPGPAVRGGQGPTADRGRGVNGVRSVWLDEVGMATVVGLPVDLDSMELLFTSLLVQATRAMAETGTGRGGGEPGPRPSGDPSCWPTPRASVNGSTRRETPARRRRRGRHGHGTRAGARRAEEAVDEAVAELFPRLRAVETRVQQRARVVRRTARRGHADLRPGCGREVRDDGTASRGRRSPGDWAAGTFSLWRPRSTRSGAIVVPKPLRDALGLRPGSTVDISRYGGGLAVIPTGRTARLVDEDGVLVATGDTAIDDDAVFGTHRPGRR